MRETVLMIGFGAIGLEVAKRLSGDSDARLNQIMVRPGREEDVRGQVNGTIQVISSLEDVDPCRILFWNAPATKPLLNTGHTFSKKVSTLGWFRSVRFLIQMFMTAWRNQVGAAVPSFVYCRERLGGWTPFRQHGRKDWTM